MTCAHVVNVALKKLPGVDVVDVSLNNALVTATFRPANRITVPQLWWLLHEKGYTPKDTTISIRGEVQKSPAGFQLKVSGSNETLALTPDPKNPGTAAKLAPKAGQTATIKGIMLPGKDLKAPVPLQVTEVK